MVFSKFNAAHEASEQETKLAREVFERWNKEQPGTSSDMERESPRMLSMAGDFAKYLLCELTNKIHLNVSILNTLNITNLGLNIFNFVTVFISNWNNPNVNLFFKWVQPISMMAAIVTSILTILATLFPHIDCDFSGATTICHQLLGHLILNCQVIPDVKTNGDDDGLSSDTIVGYVKLGIKILGFIIVLALSKMDFSTSQIANLLRCRRELKATCDDASDWINEILDDLDFIDLNNGKAFTEKLTEILDKTRKLLLIPPANFLMDSAAFTELSNAIKEIENLQTEKKNAKQTKIYSSLITLINRQHHDLLELKKNITELVKPSDRTLCTGIVLEGLSGVGKSTYGRHLLAKVAKVFGYPTKLFNLSMGINGKYSQPYMQEKIAILDEFGARRDDDPLVPIMNSVLSSDPCNLEGAAVETKNQECNLTCVVMTSNRKTYDFTRVMTEAANVAMMKRLYRFDVVDPNFKGRQQDNPHRKNGDFSHLLFKKFVPKYDVTEKIADCWQGDWVDITQQELESFVIRLVANNTIDWLERTISQSESINPSWHASILERIRSLREIASGAVKPNAGGNFFVVRLHGGSGFGKTRRQRIATAELSKALGFPVINITRPEQLNHEYNTPGIFVFDDFPIKENQANYVTFVNNLPVKSIIFQVSHHYAVRSQLGFKHKPYRISFFAPIYNKLKQISWWNWAMCNIPVTNLINTIKDSFSQTMSGYTIVNNPMLTYNEPGIYRRLGFSEWIQRPDGEWQYISTENNMTFNVSESGCTYMENAVEDIASIVLERYRGHLKSLGEVIETSLPAPQVEPDITIHVKDPVEFAKNISSMTGLSKIYNNPHSRCGYLLVDPNIESKLRNNSSLSTWMLPSKNVTLSEKQMIDLFLSKILTLLPEVKMVAYFPEHKYTYCEHALHIEKIGEPGKELITVELGYMKINGKIIDPEGFAQYYVFKGETINNKKLMNLTAGEITMAIDYYSRHGRTEVLNLYTCYIREFNEQKDKAQQRKEGHFLITWCKEHPMIAGTITAIMGIALTGLTMYGIYSFFKKASEEEDTDEFQPTKVKTNSYYSHSPPNNENRAVGYRGNKGEYEQRDKWVRTNANNELRVLVKSGDWEQVEQYIKDRPVSIQDLKAIANVRTNAVLPEDQVSTRPAITDPLIKNLKRNLCKVKADEVCYGICMGGNMILTVGHIFYHNEGTALISMDMGGITKKFNGILVAVERSKDLAIVKVIDKNFPLQKDLSKFLPTHQMDTSWNDKCFFVRPLEVEYVYSGCGSFVKNVSTPLYGANPQIYAPRSYIQFESVYMGDVNHVFRNGDCGLPLITVWENKCYIVGIHNAISNMGTAWFSPIFLKEYLNIKGGEIVQTNGKLVTMPMVERECIAVPDYSEFCQDLVPETKWDNHPDIPKYGYSPKLHIYSKPSTSKTYIRDSNCINKTRLLPSPIHPNSLTSIARQNLPKTKDGIPSPLLAQTKKYFSRKELTFDQGYFDQAEEIMTDLMKYNYGEQRQLRMHEVINGKLDGPLRRITLDTSPGPYIKIKYGLVDKSKLFVNINKDDPTLPYTLIWSNHPAAIECRDHYNTIIDAWKQGYSTTFWTRDCPKVEMLPEEEVEIDGKLRLFSECDLSMNLALKAFFGSLHNAIHEVHEHTSIRIGFNPYKLPTYLYKYIPDDWESICTDVKRMDKNMVPLFLDLFCRIVGKNFRDKDATKIFKAISRTLERQIHIQDGIMYVTDGGNPSGIYITTLLNSFVREFGFIYYYIKHFTEKIPQTIALSFGHYLTTNIAARIGDDETVYFPKCVDYTYEGLSEAWGELGFEITLSKNFASGVDFCSRELVKDEPIVIARLKKESIKAGLFWINLKRKECLPLIFTNILFEASMWDLKFFTSIKNDVLLQCKLLNIDIKQIKLFNYAKQREHFKKYVFGKELSPVIGLNDEEALEFLGGGFADIKTVFDVNSENWPYLYKKKLFEHDIDNDPTIEYTQDKTTLEWHAKATHGEYCGEGSGARKQQARFNVFKALFIKRFGISDLPNASLQDQRGCDNTI